MHERSAVPELLARAFAEKVLLSLPELAKVLPMDYGTLRRNVLAGHIEYVKLGIGRTATHRPFTLAAVLRFLAARSETFYRPPPKGRRASASSQPRFSSEVEELLARYSERLARRAAEQAAQEADLAARRAARADSAGRRTRCKPVGAHP